MKQSIFGTRERRSFLFNKTCYFAIALIVANMATAQVSTQQSFAYGDKTKMEGKKVTGDKSFKAGIITIDSSGSKLKVWVNNGGGKPFNVSIENDNGFVWSSKFKDAYYCQVYNLSALDDGEYRIKINDGKNYFEQQFYIGTTSYFLRKIKLGNL